MIGWFIHRWEVSQTAVATLSYSVPSRLDSSPKQLGYLVLLLPVLGSRPVRLERPSVYSYLRASMQVEKCIVLVYVSCCSAVTPL